MNLKRVPLVLIAVFLAVVSPAAFAGGGKDSARDPQPVVKASANQRGEPRIIAAYVIDDSSNRNFAEGMYLPQAAAAYYPTPFSVTSKERRFSFDQNLPYRILSKSELKSGVHLYTLETNPFTVDFNGMQYDDGRTYTFSFPRSSLGRDGGTAQQPASYALERAIRISAIQKGLVRLEALRYDETTEVFKVSVNVTPQSIKR